MTFPQSKIKSKIEFYEFGSEAEYVKPHAVKSRVLNSRLLNSEPEMASLEFGTCPRVS